MRVWGPWLVLAQRSTRECEGTPRVENAGPHTRHHARRKSGVSRAGRGRDGGGVFRVLCFLPDCAHRRAGRPSALYHSPYSLLPAPQSFPLLPTPCSTNPQPEPLGNNQAAMEALPKGDGTSGDLAMLDRTFDTLEARQVKPQPNSLAGSTARGTSKIEKGDLSWICFEMRV